MLYSLFVAEEYMDEDLIISYGDIIYSTEVLEKVINSSEDIVVAIDEDWESYWRERNENPLDDAETLKLDDMGFIKEIGLKPNSVDEIDGQYIGLMKFSKKGLNILKKFVKDVLENKNDIFFNYKKAYMTEVLQALIYQGYKIKSVPISGDWIEIDTVEDYENKFTIKRLKKIIS